MREDAIAFAKVRLEELLTFFGINTSVKVDDSGDGVELNIESDSTGKLIGHHGENLRAIQYLVNMMVRNHNAERVYFSVDVAGYKKARAEQLSADAKQRAEKVAASGEEETLRPMNAAERRIVHMTLADVPEVFTESVGEEPRRRIVIKKKGE